MPDSYDELSFQEKYKINELTEREEFHCTEEEFKLLQRYIAALEEEADKAHTRNDELEDRIYEMEEDFYSPSKEFLEELVEDYYMHVNKTYNSLEEIILKAEHVLKYEDVSE